MYISYAHVYRTLRLHVRVNLTVKFSPSFLNFRLSFETMDTKWKEMSLDYKSIIVDLMNDRHSGCNSDLPRF